MSSICFYFQVHQPFRLKNYSFFDIGVNPYYEDEESNKNIMKKVAHTCYLPMNKLLLNLIKKYNGDFKVNFSISGNALDQFEQYAPEVLISFQELAYTGCVEFLAETYYHSLAFIFSEKEFKKQVLLHQKRIQNLFNYTPCIFRNTELIYNNNLAQCIEKMGYKAVLAEGADHILGWRSPNFIYRPLGCSKLKLFLKNYRLSDDIAFRFSNKNWEGYPLTAECFTSWINNAANDEIINLFMDYETFGEHQWADTGIFSFIESLPYYILQSKNNILTLSTLAEHKTCVADLDVPHTISWADTERDLTAWLGNSMQQDAIESLYRLEALVFASESIDIINTWRRLQTSDHFYYMCTKWFSDGDVHKYFNPYPSPYDAYINYMNVLADLETRISQNNKKHNTSYISPISSYKTLQLPATKIRRTYATAFGTSNSF